MNSQESIRRLLESLEQSGISNDKLKGVLTSLRNRERYQAGMADRVRDWAESHPEDALDMAVALLAGIEVGLPADDVRWMAVGHALQILKTDDRQEETPGE